MVSLADAASEVLLDMEGFGECSGTEKNVSLQFHHMFKSVSIGCVEYSYRLDMSEDVNTARYVPYCSRQSP